MTGQTAKGRQRKAWRAGPPAPWRGAPVPAPQQAGAQQQRESPGARRRNGEALQLCGRRLLGVPLEAGAHGADHPRLRTQKVVAAAGQEVRGDRRLGGEARV